MRWDEKACICSRIAHVNVLAIKPEAHLQRSQDPMATINISEVLPRHLSLLSVSLSFAIRYKNITTPVLHTDT